MSDNHDPLVWPDDDDDPTIEPPNTDLDIDRLLRWRRERHDRIRGIEERAAKMIHEIEEWRTSTIEADRRGIEDIDRNIVAFLVDQTGATSFNSPFGKVTSRRGALRLVVDNAIGDVTSTLDAIAALDPDLIERRIRIADVKRRLAPGHVLDGELPDIAPAVDPDTGAIIPGLLFETGGRTWTIK